MNNASEKKVVAISGSPSEMSKTAQVADFILKDISLSGISIRHIRLRALPVESLLNAKGGPQIQNAISAIEEADGIIVATPIYKAAYSGLLKMFLDILPQFAFAGKVVLPCATGGSLAHVLALDYALRPVLQSMGARNIVQSQLILESQIRPCGDAIELDEIESLQEAIHHFKCAIFSEPSDSLLGHPRPQRFTLKAAE